MMNIQEILNKVSGSECLSYDVYNTLNKIDIIIEDFDGFEEDWNEIELDVNEDEVMWAKSLDCLIVDGWAIEVHWASEDI